MLERKLIPIRTAISRPTWNIQRCYEGPVWVGSKEAYEALEPVAGVLYIWNRLRESDNPAYEVESAAEQK